MKTETLLIVGHRRRVLPKPGQKGPGVRSERAREASRSPRHLARIPVR